MRKGRDRKRKEKKKEKKRKKYRKAEYVQRCVCFVNVQSSFRENVIFSVCALMCNAAYVILIMWNYEISYLSSWDSNWHPNNFLKDSCTHARAKCLNVRAHVYTPCARVGNAAYIIFIMCNSISGLDAWYHFRFNVSYGVAVMVRSHQIKFQVIF